MKLHFTFQLSTYLCLASATACLGYMEQLHLPRVLPFYIAIEVLILGAFIVHDRWLMPRRVADLLAVAILIGWLTWFGLELVRVRALSPEALDIMPWVMPRIGPLLAILLLAMLFLARRQRDYWLLHGLALAQVALACVLDRDAIFGLLLCSYIVTGIWSMVLFYLWRESGAEQFRAGTTAEPMTLPRLPWHGSGLYQTGGWTLLTVGMAIMLFFAIPRRSQGILLTAAERQTAVNTTGMDLNGIGPLEITDELVIRVEARNAQGEAENLGPDRRWRGLTCSHYKDGRWKPFSIFDEKNVALDSLGPLAPGELQLTFQVDLSRARLGQLIMPKGGDRYIDLSSPRGRLLFLAEPMALTGSIPRLRVRDPRIPMLTFRVQETALHTPVSLRTSWLVYHQVSLAHGESANQWSAPLSWWPRHADQMLDSSHKLLSLCSTVCQPLAVYTLHAPLAVAADREHLFGSTDARRDYKNLLLQLPRREGTMERGSPGIAGKARDILQKAELLNGAPEEKALALERYLSLSQEYQYSLNRQRQAKKIDPTEDFVLNVKQGHCELFASALALMLRSQEIPARIVLGFRGAEWNTYGEYHEVRQYHAHAWVEAMIERIDPKDGLTRSQWLTLDPTPPGSIAAARAEVRQGLFRDEIEYLRYLWDFYILDYGGEEQRERLAFNVTNVFDWFEGKEEEAGEAVGQIPKTETAVGLPRYLVGIVPALVLLGGLCCWLIRRRARHPTPRHPVLFYTRLLRALMPLALRPSSAQTPREFASRAAGVLQSLPATAAVADIPLSVVQAFYDVRYGGASLDPSRSSAVDQDLYRLEHAIQHGNNGRTKKEES